MHDLINQLRYLEYRERVKKSKIQYKQILVDKDLKDIRSNIHIVYVMSHVGVCGGSKVIFEHANGLSELGARVTIISHFPKPIWFPIDVEYISIPFQIELSKAIPNCDVIVATYWEQIGVCVETGIAPVVYFEQGDFHLFDWEHLGTEKQELISHQFQLPYKIITVSNEMAKIIKNLFNRDSEVFHNSINTNVFFSGDKVNDRKRYMMIVGSEQTEFKGINDLKKVFQKVKDKGFDIELLWVTPIAPVNRLGEVYVNPSQQTIGELYRKAHFYICGSHYESFALPPLEAMASGTPVITTNNVGVNEYAVNFHNCLMNEPKDIDEMVINAIRILQDEDLYNSLRINGLETASRFSWEKTLCDLLSFYKSVSTKRVKEIYSLENWMKKYTIDDLEDENDEDIINSFLSTSNADEIQLLVKEEIIKGMPFYKWETLIKRNFPSSGRIERLYIKLNKVNNKPKVYSEEVSLFINENFKDALSIFWKKLNELKIGTLEHAVCIRWVCLCLYELRMDTELFEILQEAIKEYPLYTDLLFLHGMLLNENGRAEEFLNEINKVSIIQDALFYPEFIGSVKNRIQNYLKDIIN